MKKWIHQNIKASSENTESGWELVRSKPVYDFDGFLTDYTLWYNNLTDEWVTIFGDKDLYTPENAEPDMSFGSNENDAQDWFDDYSADEEDDEYF